MNKKNSKQFLIYILIIALIFITAFLVSYKKEIKNIIFPKEVSNQQPVKEKNVIIEIEDGQKQIVLQQNQNNILFSQSLEPVFIIKVPKKIDFGSLKFYLDNFNNDLITDKFFKDTIEKGPSKNEIKIKLPYSLFPKEYKIRTEYKNLSTNKIKKDNYIFNLVFYDNFSVELENSKFWSLTEKTIKHHHNNWLIENGFLVTKPISGFSDVSSLAFLRSFPADVFIDFEFISLSEKVNLSVYLGNTFAFMIGDGDNHTIKLKKAEIINGQEKNPSIETVDYNIEINQKYHARILREDNNYKLFLKKIENEASLTDITSEDLILNKTDKDIEKTVGIKFDNIGFASWKGGEGIQIDNVYIFNNPELFEVEKNNHDF